MNLIAYKSVRCYCSKSVNIQRSNHKHGTSSSKKPTTSPPVSHRQNALHAAIVSDVLDGECLDRIRARQRTDHWSGSGTASGWGEILWPRCKYTFPNINAYCFDVCTTSRTFRTSPCGWLCCVRQMLNWCVPYRAGHVAEVSRAVATASRTMRPVVRQCWDRWTSATRSWSIRCSVCRNLWTMQESKWLICVNNRSFTQNI